MLWHKLIRQIKSVAAAVSGLFQVWVSLDQSTCAVQAHTRGRPCPEDKAWWTFLPESWLSGCKPHRDSFIHTNLRGWTHHISG